MKDAVARAAGLLAVAVVPAAAGICGADYTESEAFGAGFQVVLLICAGLLVAGAVVGVVWIRRALGVQEVASGDRLPLEECRHRGLTGPQLHPAGVATPEKDR